MDSRKNESGPPPSFYTTTTSTTTTSTVASTQVAVPGDTTIASTVSASFSTGTTTLATSDTCQTTTAVAVPSSLLSQTQLQPAAAVTQASAVAVLSKISHNTSAVSAAITASAVSNTVLASVTAVSTVGLDGGGGEIGVGGGVAGHGGGQSLVPLLLTQTTITTGPSSVEKGDAGAVPNITDPSGLASSPKLLRPAVFDKVI